MSEQLPRRRLNWFSPLRPARTEVGHYAVRTLPALARHFNVVVWTDRPYWPHELEACATVRRWEGAHWPELNAADVTLYHIGNDARFHGWIWEIARQHPGIVVLHDVRLHQFFAAMLRASDEDGADYLNAIRRYYGAAAAVDAARLLAGTASAATLGESMPLTEMALERARGAIVHSVMAFTQVGSLARCPVVQLELPYPSGAPSFPRAWDGVLRLVIFGYLGSNRRIDAVLEAMASFPDSRRLHLDIFGEVEQPDLVLERIQGLGIGDIVRVRGFVPEPKLDEALDQSHLALNLRYPSMGEASASQLRIWSRGLASLVTRTGWYAELPQDVVGFVDPENEVADLHRHFQRALDNPSALHEMGIAGRRHLETRHRPDAYAAELAMAIDRMLATPVPIVDETVNVVSRVLSASGFSEVPKAIVARRAADEICRWLGKSA